MTVLQEILDWSTDRPAWQRDALRRLVMKGELSADDLASLATICKAAHGLAEQQAVNPLTSQDIPDTRYAAPAVTLLSISHHRGVNALAPDQTLHFGSNLTVVYGDNAAGKTGYIRILKSACRARGREKILGNVVAGALPPTPVVAIKYRVGTENDPRVWADPQAEDELVSRVSVFDSQCASVYLTEKTDVAFRPFGLDLFDKLVRACKAIRAQLDREQRALVSNALGSVRAIVPEGTAAAKLLANITSLTKPEAVTALSRLSASEEARLTLLETSLRDLQANDPTQLSRRLTLRAKRIQALSRHIKNIEGVLSAKALGEVLDAQTTVRGKVADAQRLREAAFGSGTLAGTGSESWTALWESGRHFSENAAYPGQPFPVVDEGAQCILCQQGLDHAARDRLQKFQTFVTSTTEQGLRQARDTFERLRNNVTDLQITTGSIDETLQELQIEHAAVADRIGSALTAAESRRQAVVLALEDETIVPQELPPLLPVLDATDSLAAEIAERVATLSAGGTNEARKRMTAEVQELRARRLLAQHESVVLEEIERKRQYAAYGLCLTDTKTQAITKKSTVVTRTVFG